ncbi:alpha/beta fold hydrolase [Microlunatus parietis]|uniref:Pimeloyl-ACP methyl ester carboxylesterase n=1 Tax=Microlunatus parietis TaxID=682979 RepID=A0A7Y9L9P7_9ACTN|nr:alpha/beta hydrolase [Microlunatus parietis]NYE68790.1 pimeloyl-ACP methyl ester carboxylesterase [Microlunatus parietis]
MAGSVMIMPGLAVRGYAIDTAATLAGAGHPTRLLDPVTWRSVPDRLTDYGERAAADLERDGEDVDLLVGLSVGTQAAAVTAAETRRVRRLLLISPTVDPALRNRRRLLGKFLAGGEPRGPGLGQQIADWSRAGPARIARGFDSAIRLELEDVLPRIKVPTMIVHCEHDSLGSHDYAASLAVGHGADLLLVPGAGHSWPADDAAAFLRLVRELLR